MTSFVRKRKRRLTSNTRTRNNLSRTTATRTANQENGNTARNDGYGETEPRNITVMRQKARSHASPTRSINIARRRASVLTVAIQATPFETAPTRSTQTEYHSEMTELSPNPSKRVLGNGQGLNPFELTVLATIVIIQITNLANPTTPNLRGLASDKKTRWAPS
jgi:hypothetical protein